MLNFIKTNIKYLLSFRRSSWDLQDYPIQFRRQKPDKNGPCGLRAVFLPWEARIVKWWLMSGHGNTREEAYRELCENFDAFKAKGEPLPRPGTIVPIRFASSCEIKKYESMARDFLKQIFDRNYEECFISDGTSIYDFISDGFWDTDWDDQKEEAERAKVFAIIKRVYEVDVSDITDGNLIKVFIRILQSRGMA